MSGTTSRDSYTVTLNASASFNGTDYPDFTILVDGQQIGTGIANSNNITSFSFPNSLAPNTAHTVSIEFTNYNSSAQLLNVQSIAINGQSISSGSTSETYVSTIGGTRIGWGQIYWGGIATFAVPAADFPVTTPSTGTTSTGTTSTGTTSTGTTSTGTTLNGSGSTAGAGVTPAPTTLGSGPDTLALLVTEDAYDGDAQFTVSVDGVKVGGTQTVTALNSSGTPQVFDVLGSFGSSSHTVTVDFLNDAYGGTATTDRNLYVTGATINGKSIAGSALSETSAGPQSFSFTGNAATTVVTTPPATVTPPVTVTPPTTVTIGSGTDTLALSVAEDAYNGDAQFVVDVDNVQIGGVQTATAINGNNQIQTFNVLGNFGSAHHTVSITFLNDAYGGTATTDRNLYVKGATIDGVAIPSATLTETSDGTQSFTFSGTAAATLPAGVYVSSSGSDSGDGTAAHPFATFQHALSVMEAAKTNVLYVSGTLNGQTLNLTEADSGDTIMALNGGATLNGQGSVSTLVSLSGANNVTISGLTFAGASGPALSATSSSNDTFINNTFNNNNEGALFTGSSNVSFKSNTLNNSATSAVEIKDQSNSGTFTNNTINGVGAINGTGGGFFAHGVSYDTISNNLVENTAGAGISVEDFGQGYTYNKGVTISENKIINTAQSTQSTDTGAIYILGRSDTNLGFNVSMNFISNAGNVNPAAHVEGIYLDDNTSGVTVTSNIVQGVQSDALQIHGGYSDIVTNNIFDLGMATATAGFIEQPEPDQPATIQPALTNDKISGNIVVSQQAQPDYAWVYFDPQALVQFVSGNLYWDPKVAANGSPYSAFGVYVTPKTTAGSLPLMPAVTDTAPVVGDPKFVSTASGAYSFGAGSAATTIGFTPIDQSLIGPH